MLDSSRDSGGMPCVSEHGVSERCRGYLGSSPLATEVKRKEKKNRTRSLPNSKIQIERPARTRPHQEATWAG